MTNNPLSAVSLITASGFDSVINPCKTNLSVPLQLLQLEPTRRAGVWLCSSPEAVTGGLLNDSAAMAPAAMMGCMAEWQMGYPLKCSSVHSPNLALVH